MSALYLAENDPPSKRAILKAALHAFVREGIAATSIRDIADSAGYTNPALFKFFRSKDDLALYLFERCYRENVAVLRHAVQAEGGFEPKLHAALEALTRFVSDHPDEFFFVQDNLRVLWPKLPKASRSGSMLLEFARLIELGRSEGVVREDVSIELQVAAMVGFLLQSARMQYFKELPRDIVDYVSDLESMILHMLQK